MASRRVRRAGLEPERGRRLARGAEHDHDPGRLLRCVGGRPSLDASRVARGCGGAPAGFVARGRPAAGGRLALGCAARHVDRPALPADDDVAARCGGRAGGGGRARGDDARSRLHALVERAASTRCSARSLGRLQRGAVGARRRCRRTPRGRAGSSARRRRSSRRAPQPRSHARPPRVSRPGHRD